MEGGQQREALARIFSLLNPQGRFIYTLHNPRVRLQTVGGRFVLEMSVAVLGEGGIVKGTQEFEILDSNGRSMKQLRLPLQFAPFEKDEFQELVEGQGFVVEAVYGDYERATYNPKQSGSMIMDIEKRARLINRLTGAHGAFR